MSVEAEIQKMLDALVSADSNDDRYSELIVALDRAVTERARLQTIGALRAIQQGSETKPPVAESVKRDDLRTQLHIFFGLEHLGDCLGTDHRDNESALCAKATEWATPSASAESDTIDGEVQLAYSHSAGTVIEVYLGEGMLEDAEKWVDRKVRITEV